MECDMATVGIDLGTSNSAAADFTDKVSADHRQRIEAQINDVKDAIGKKDADEAMTRAEALKKILQEAVAPIYAYAGGGQTSATGAGAGEARPSADAEQARVVDAEYRETRP
jgi:molecular chaperone DnaK